jgi:hypothetical protein
MKARTLLGLAASLAALGTLASYAAKPAEANRFDGRPVFEAGSDFRYFVWREGDKWCVRWTTLGRFHHFTGNVVAEGGDLHNLKRIDVEEETRVTRNGRPGHVWVGPRGRVHAGGGRPAVVETRVQDKIEKDGNRRIWWNSRTNGDIDGFDFKVKKEVEQLRFTLEIDGASRANFVRVGANNGEVARNPFVVELK